MPNVERKGGAKNGVWAMFFDFQSLVDQYLWRRMLVIIDQIYEEEWENLSSESERAHNQYAVVLYEEKIIFIKMEMKYQSLPPLAIWQWRSDYFSAGKSQD